MDRFVFGASEYKTIYPGGDQGNNYLEVFDLAGDVRAAGPRRTGVCSGTVRSATSRCPPRFGALREKGFFGEGGGDLSGPVDCTHHAPRSGLQQGNINRYVPARLAHESPNVGERVFERIPLRIMSTIMRRSRRCRIVPRLHCLSTAIAARSGILRN